MKYRVEGIDNVLRNLNKEIKGIKDRGFAGMVKAVNIIRRDSLDTAPTVPVDLGNLRASWFTVTGRGPVKSGASSGSFAGPEAGEMASNHSSVQNKERATVSGRRYPVVAFGFSASYAAAVHEMVGANFKGNGTGAKFLERAIERNKAVIIDTIRSNAKI